MVGSVTGGLAAGVNGGVKGGLQRDLVEKVRDAGRLPALQRACEEGGMHVGTCEVRWVSGGGVAGFRGSCRVERAAAPSIR